MAAVWVIDTSSLIAIKSTVARVDRDRIFESMTVLVKEARLCFPRQVMAELKRDSTDKRRPDPPCVWATGVEADACKIEATLEQVRAVLAIVPDILDPSKESGADEADPYVLTLAQTLRSDGIDARVVTEETKDSPQKLSLNTACGILGIPSAPLRGFFRVERISV